MNHRPRTLAKNVAKVTPKRRKRQLAPYDCVTTRDGREGVVVDDHGGGHYEVELFDPPGIETMSIDDCKISRLSARRTAPQVSRRVSASG
jgi:hypothetical protein